MTMDEKTVRFLEEHIPELAVAALKQAYWRALASGHSVLKAEENALVEVHPDGTTTFIKSLPPSIPVIKGQILEIQ